MTSQAPTTVFYNSACPVCDAGIASQKDRMQGCDVQWVDVHTNPQAAAELGAGLEQVRERLHVRAPDGEVSVGAQALQALWSQTPGQRWLARLTALPLAGRLATLAYNAFARVLYRWNLKRGHWQIQAGTTQTKQEKTMARAPYNADPAELAKFSALATRWWDPDKEFRPLHRINPLRLEWIDSLAEISGKRALDVGCGGGILAEAMAQKGADVTGIDMADKPLIVAALHAKQVNALVRYEHISAEDLALDEPQGFDVVTCMEMLEHVPQPALVIEACARLVKPGGWVFFSTINRNPLSWFMAIFGAEYVLRLLPRGTHHWKSFIKPEELVAVARANGLVLKDHRGLGYNPFTRAFRLHQFMGVGYLLAMKRQAAPGS